MGVVTASPPAPSDGAPWAEQRLRAAQAIARPNDQRIAAAAAARLTPQDHAATFTAWCDAFCSPERNEPLD